MPAVLTVHSLKVWLLLELLSLQARKSAPTKKRALARLTAFALAAAASGSARGWTPDGPRCYSPIVVPERIIDLIENRTDFSPRAFEHVATCTAAERPCPRRCVSLYRAPAGFARRPHTADSSNRSGAVGKTTAVAAAATMAVQHWQST